MNSITVKNLECALEQRLRERASENGRSLEEEVLEILREALAQKSAPEVNLGTALHQLFKPFSVDRLDIPAREPMRKPPHLS